MEYIWSSKTNSFDSYMPQYRTIVNEETGERTRVEIPCGQKLYSEDEVESILTNRKEGEAIKDVNGVPTVFTLITDSELAINAGKQRINELKALLASTDYQAIQWAEGVRSEEVYAPMRLQREAWREEIRKIEVELGL